MVKLIGQMKSISDICVSGAEASYYKSKTQILFFRWWTI